MFIGLVVKFIVVLHKVHNSLLIRVHQVDDCHVPLLVSVLQLRCAHLYSTHLSISVALLSVLAHSCATPSSAECSFLPHAFIPPPLLPLFMCLFLLLSCLPFLPPPLYNSSCISQHTFVKNKILNTTCISILNPS